MQSVTFCCGRMEATSEFCIATFLIVFSRILRIADVVSYTENVIDCCTF